MGSEWLVQYTFDHQWENHRDNFLESNTTAIALRAAEAELQAGHWQAARRLALPFQNDRGFGLQARSVIANVAMQMGDYEEAVKQFSFLTRALPGRQQIRAALSTALNNQGSTAWLSGEADVAEYHYREALEVDQRNALAWFNLAVCAHKQNKFAEASRAFAGCTKLDPSRNDARLQWAVCERLNGQPNKAKVVLQGFDEAALSAQLMVDIGAEWELLSEPSAAARVYALAASKSVGDAGLLLRIAQAQLQSGDVSKARITGRRAKKQASDEALNLKASMIASLGLPAVPGSRTEIVQARETFADGVATLESDWPADRLQASSLSLDDLAHSHYLLAYQGENDKTLAKTFGHWYGAAASAIAVGKGGESELVPGHIHRRRIALVSARWNMSTISAYFGSWIGALINTGWEVHVYHLGSSVDDWTSLIAERATAFHHFPGPLKNVVDSIRETGPAVIIYPEVGLNPRIHVLAALKLAPKQAFAWGHPVSSGLSSMDIYFSCSEMEPVDAASHYCEQLVLLPHLGTNYRRLKHAKTLSRDTLGLPENQPLFLAPHASVKMQSEFDDLLVGIAQRNSHAKFVMFKDSVPALTAKLRQRLSKRFDQHGIDLAKHMIWLPRMPVERFRSVLAACDAMLDSPGFSGGNTSLDAIGQGLPLVALPGSSMRSRQSAAMLRMSGAKELVASSPEDYINISLNLISNFEYASEMRRRLLDKGRALFGDQRPLETLVERLEDIDAPVLS